MSSATRAAIPNYDSNAPIIATEPVQRCPVCNGEQRSLHAEGYDYELQTCGNIWRFWSCDECSAIWLDPRPALSELGTIYPSTYYAYEMSETLSPFVLRGKAFLDRMKFQSILRRLDHTPQSFLDVGCGDGRYMQQFAERGVAKEAIYGIDLPSPAIPKLRAKGFRVFAGRVEDCDVIEPQSIDLIVIFHVIEHVADPINVLRKLAGWLAPGGVLALETPNTSSIDHALFAGGWWGGYHIPRHWTLFNEPSFHRALKTVGLDFLSTQYQTGHAFWMNSFHHPLKYNSTLPMPRFARLLDPMHSRVLLAGVTGFDIVRRTLGARTSAMLVLARKPVV